MNSEELAEWLLNKCDCGCNLCIVSSIEDCHLSCIEGTIQWLEQEVEE